MVKVVLLRNVCWRYECHGVWLALLVNILLLTTSIHAAPPNVTGLYPPGGQRGSSVEITAIGSFDTWPVQVWTSSPHLAVTAGKDKGKLTIKIATDTPPGTYWLRCHDAQGASALRPFIVGILPELMETEPNETVQKAQLITLPSLVNGKLNKNGDVDCFVVNLKQGHTLVASVESHQTLRSAGDMVMQLTNPAGTVLAQNHDYHGLDPQIVYTAALDGPVAVRLFGFPANPDSSIRYSGGDLYIYRLVLSTSGFADYALPLAVNEKKLEPVRLMGWNLTPQSMVGTVLPRYDVGDAFHPQVAGVVPLRLERWPTFDDTVLGRSNRPSLAAPICLTAQLTRDKSTYQTSIKLAQGKKLVIQALSQSLGLQVDPVLTIKDAVGKEVLKAEATALNSDLTTSFTPPQDGIYTVLVHDLHGRHGQRMAFLLRVVLEEPDFSLSVDADRFTLTAGKALDIPVKVAVVAGFKDDVQLQVVGLPASVQWKLLSSTGPVDKKVITLRFECKEHVSSGFQIFGQSSGKTPIKKSALAGLADFGVLTGDLWLTGIKGDVKK